MLAKQELARMERNKPNKNADPTILTKNNQIDIQKAVGRNYADFWNNKDRYLVLKVHVLLKSHLMLLKDYL